MLCVWCVCSVRCVELSCMHGVYSIYLMSGVGKPQGQEQLVSQVVTAVDAFQAK